MKFLPSKNDINTFAKLKLCKLTRRQWIKTITKKILYNFVDDKNDQIYNNQQYRAQILLEKLLLTKKRKICFMDGHGRFVYQLLNQIYTNKKFYRLKKIKMFVCEINSFTHKLHKLVFPKDIRSIYQDIFKYNKTYDDKDCIFYYNFCSFGKNYRYIIENIIREINKNRELMITFCVRKADYLYKFARKLDEICDQTISRYNTKTWYIPKQNNNYIKLKDFI